ncbi:MAG: FkbM family methyltransferase [Puniceicoccales bacterium]|nr:FkbM family methyltransferase [Puniceicoccales bacterium]
MLQFYEQYVPKDSFAIDIGAHTGDTTVPMAVVAGSKGLVLGLEPNPYVFKVLERNAQLNKNLAQIIPLCCAATSENGTFEFNYSDASFCNGGFLSKIQTKSHHHSHKLMVKGINLSTYLNENMKAYLPKLSFVKVDAEGYDKDVLSSLTNIIKTYRPIIMAECYKRLTKEERFSLFNIFEDFGPYKLFKLDDNRHTANIHIPSGEMMLREPHFNFVALPE